MPNINRDSPTLAIGDNPTPKPLNVKNIPTKAPVTELSQIFSAWFIYITTPFKTKTPSKQLILIVAKFNVNDAVIKFIRIAAMKPITIPIKPFTLSFRVAPKKTVYEANATHIKPLPGINNPPTNASTI